MKAISVRIRSVSTAKAGGQRRHDCRIGSQPAYVDAGRSSSNSVLIEPLGGGDLRRICVERTTAQGGRKRALRRDAAVATTGILTFSKEAQVVLDGLPAAEQDTRIRTSCEAIATELGCELTGLVVHRDESALHAHFQVPARCPDGTAVSRAADCSKLQDVAAEAWSDLGITRGKRKVQRIADGEPESAWVHRSVRQLHSDLPAEIEQARAARDTAASRLDEMQSRVTETQARLAEVESDAAKAAKLGKRLDAYEKRLADRQAELVKVEKRLSAAEGVGAFFAAVTGRGKRQEAEAKAERLAKRAKREMSAREEAEARADRAEQYQRIWVQDMAQTEAKLDQVTSDLAELREATGDLEPAVLRYALQLGQEVLEAQKRESVLNDLDLDSVDLPSTNPDHDYTPGR